MKVSWGFEMLTVKYVKRKWMVSCRNRLLEHPKTENLMSNRDILGVSYEFSGLVGCAIPHGIKHKDIYRGLNARNYLAKEYEHVANFHKKMKLYLKKV